MSVNLRLPNINGASEQEKLQQVQRYLYQLLEQLNFALNTIEASEGKSSPDQPTALSRVVVNAPAVMSLTEDQATFQAIKPYIIKSADIVNAYYETISKKLESVYVAQSDFGAFMEQTSQEIEETSTSTTQRFENIQTVIAKTDSKVEGVKTGVQAVEQKAQTIEGNVQTIATDVEALDTSIADVDKSVQSVDKNLWQLDKNLKDAKDGIDSSLKTLTDDLGQLDSGVKDLKDNVESELKDVKGAIDNIVYTLIEVNACIKSGLLYYDENEIPIYGLEIGQKNTINGVEVFNKFARFTSDRLSFYDQNGIEVAYISDRKLYINNVEITISLKMGGIVSSVMSNGDVVEKWVGRR
jgi:chromosome segregation ATPase